MGLQDEATPTQQRVAFGAVVLLLAGAGIAWTFGLWGGNKEGEQESGAQPSPKVSATPGAEAVEDWFPWSRAEFAAAGATAAEFGERYATMDADQDPEDYAEDLAELAEDDLAERVQEGRVGVAELEELDEGESRTGQAHVDQIRSYDDQSVTVVITVSTDSDEEELGDYAVTVVPDEGDQWRVYDFQPAEAGQAGDTSGS